MSRQRDSLQLIVIKLSSVTAWPWGKYYDPSNLVNYSLKNTKRFKPSTLLFIPLVWPFCQCDTNEYVKTWIWVIAETIRRIWGGSESENQESVHCEILLMFLVKYYMDDKGERDRWDMLHAWGRRKMHTEFWWGGLKQRDCMVDLILDGKVMDNKLKWKEGANGLHPAQSGEQ